MRAFSRFLTAAICAAVLVPSAALAELKVVASFSILGDMVRNVAGEHAEVTTIVGPDADAHLYQPSVDDARAAAEADVIFVNGMGFETWSAELIAASGTEASVIVATEGVEPLMVEGEIDPHAWNALPNARIYVANIAEGLASADPTNAEAYRENAAAYAAKIDALHARAQAEIGALPASNRTVVTAHDAFGYLGAAYGLTFLAPLGIDTDAEPSARELAELIAQIREVGAAALFVENVTSPDLVAQIGRETGLEIGGRLYSDALSVKGGPATSYLAMVEHNLTSIVTALSAGG